ncbi:MAG: acyl carrier protein [Schwartzia sp.]|nr:acyl carrier protein [Schwartzia sp. (in: firmicutes)]
MAAPSKEEFIARFVEMLETDRKDITLETDLSDIEEWDSVSGVNFIGVADTEYGMELNPMDVRMALSVQDLYDLIVGED